MGSARRGCAGCKNDVTCMGYAVYAATLRLFKGLEAGAWVDALIDELGSLDMWTLERLGANSENLCWRRTGILLFIGNLRDIYALTSCRAEQEIVTDIAETFLSVNRLFSETPEVFATRLDELRSRVLERARSYPRHQPLDHKSMRTAIDQALKTEARRQSFPTVPAEKVPEPVLASVPAETVAPSQKRSVDRKAG